MSRNSRVVPEHLDTISVTDSAPSSEIVVFILEKWRPHWKFNNRRVTGWAPCIHRSRAPVSLGDVGGVPHPSVSLSGKRLSNTRFSRRGKKQIRSDTSVAE